MPTWIKRVQDFMYADKEDASYQVQQAKIAIANGGLFGKGPGKSEQRNFLPHPYSDFIYAIIIEEYGLVGGAVIMFIYLVFLVSKYQTFSAMSLCIWSISGSGVKFYVGDTGNGKHGGEC